MASKFLQVDIECYYAIINPIVFNQALNFRIKISDLSRRKIYIILATRDTLADFDCKLWRSLDKVNAFDIIMGSYNFVEVSNLVGIYILSLIQSSFPEVNMGVYIGMIIYFFLDKSSKVQFERLKKRFF